MKTANLVNKSHIGWSLEVGFSWRLEPWTGMAQFHRIAAVGEKSVLALAPCFYNSAITPLAQMLL